MTAHPSSPAPGKCARKPVPATIRITTPRQRIAWRARATIILTVRTAPTAPADEHRSLTEATVNVRKSLNFLTAPVARHVPRHKSSITTKTAAVFAATAWRRTAIVTVAFHAALESLVRTAPAAAPTFARHAAPAAYQPTTKVHVCDAPTANKETPPTIMSAPHVRAMNIVTAPPAGVSAARRRGQYQPPPRTHAGHAGPVQHQTPPAMIVSHAMTAPSAQATASVPPVTGEERVMPIMMNVCVPFRVNCMTAPNAYVPPAWNSTAIHARHAPPEKLAPRAAVVIRVPTVREPTTASIACNAPPTDSVTVTAFAVYVSILKKSQTPTKTPAFNAVTAWDQTPTGRNAGHARPESSVTTRWNASHARVNPSRPTRALRPARHAPALKEPMVIKPSVWIVPTDKPAPVPAARVRLVPASTFPMQTLVPVCHVPPDNTPTAIFDACHVSPDNSPQTRVIPSASHAQSVKSPPPPAPATFHARHAPQENGPPATNPRVPHAVTENDRGPVTE